MPLDPDLRSQLDTWRKAAGLEALLLTSPFSVDWASGHETPVETGLNPFADGPSLLLVEAGRVTLLHPNCEAPMPGTPSPRTPGAGSTSSTTTPPPPGCATKRTAPCTSSTRPCGM
jgi:hypothetical protein